MNETEHIENKRRLRELLAISERERSCGREQRCSSSGLLADREGSWC